MIRINLLPERRRRRLLPESGVVAVVLVTIGALIGAYSYGAWRNARIVTETNAINREITVIRPKAAEVLKLELKIEDLRGREALLRSLEGRAVPWAEMLTDLATRTPRDAWLSSAALQYERGAVLNLQGSALSYDAVARFMTSLSASRFYSGVDLSSAQAATASSAQRVVQFGLSVNVRPVSPPPPPSRPRPDKSSRSAQEVAQ